MRESGQNIWWRRSTQLAGGTVGGALVVLMACWLIAGPLSGQAVLGIPLGYFLLGVIAPLVVAGLTFWFARRQQSLDHWYDVIGKQD